MELAQGPGSRRPDSDGDGANLAEVPHALEYYDIHNNGRKGYVIRPVVLASLLGKSFDNLNR
jgi:hypothetical protein